MNERFVELACRRRRLLEIIEAQRKEVFEISRRWQKPLATVDAGLHVVRFLQRHPALVVSGVTTLLALRRNGIVGLAQEKWRLWCSNIAHVFLASRSPIEARNTEAE